MKTVVATLLSSAAVVAVAGAAFIYFGIFNVAATDRHWPAVHWVLETARTRSIVTHASGITPPDGFDEQAKVIGAVQHFSEHCAVCHGSPGGRRGDFAEGMYPQPPALADVVARYKPAELFWILKNGIKMSGMPAMASDGDDMLWSTVAFLQRLPGMSEDEFNELWMTSQMQGEHGGMKMDHGSMNMGASPGK